MTAHPTQPINADEVTVHFTNGDGVLYRLDADLPGGAVLAMPLRDQALAKALLELALANVRRAEAL